MPTILFVTTHNLATNPRIVKEVKLALAHQYKVKLIAFAFEGWSKPLNDALLLELVPQIEYIELSASRKPLLAWIKSTVAFILSKCVLFFNKKNMRALSIRSNKRAFLLQSYVNKNIVDAQLVVAHNPGSFYPSYLLAKEQGIPLGIDLEDFHEGETNDKQIQRQLKSLVHFILPNAAYISAASPLILQHSIGNLKLANKTNFVVENYFDSDEFEAPIEIDSSKLKLIWFSQHIKYGRGLDKIIPVIKAHPDKFELHVYGNADVAFVEKELAGINNVEVYPALPQNELHKKLAHYDIGLALEEKTANANKNYALSNKILAYVQAGLFVLASDTAAQQLIIQQHNGNGIITSLEFQSLSDSLLHCFSSMLLIRENKQKRHEAASSKNWETESAVIAKQWMALTSSKI